jgi:hypothetical protein
MPHLLVLVYVYMENHYRRGGVRCEQQAMTVQSNAINADRGSSEPSRVA